MDFRLNKEQEGIRAAAREFAQGEFDKEIALEHEKTHTFPKSLWSKACSLGFLGIHFPEQYGGQEYGILENALVVEEFCRQDSSLGIAISLADFASEIILRFGTEDQKKKYLIPIAKGEAISSGGFTEPDHGSDITMMNTTAVKKGDEYIINGVKTFITNGTISNFVLLLCQTNPEAKPSYRGQSVILVDRDTPGFTSTDVGEKMGIRMTSTGELSFNDVRVPISNLVGEENRGFYQVLEFFDESRIEIAAQALGIAQGSFDRAMAYTKQRSQFGKKLAEFQVTQHKLADMITKIETARLIVYKAAWNYDQGRIDPKLTSMAKMYAGRVAVEVADEAIQLHGGYGYMLEYEVERFYRDAKITEIYEGTKEIQKNTISSALLGKL
ncbi:MAG: acyl-CoA dehydrogenase family protein [Deltaproteobacteria bacterium]|nr:acyl-CoA dehydrogenase family protein [Deltaproteobacteria bacterium]MBW1919299.1 acyl-CoA dehydrogenase family protein [Deltaproteobacteria bacterium]MBW1933957.1 acyl-CoA dehydrogenase family protein [Deltaproteobacteria bacterium]MBW1976623.1 acyl-CoA dehydrogenase family protein [Deltaproteobacteria bacterium]MBW2043296.1 acyl-CoA dehydrogenase family protein [Deltaproteobacteria bacterium]